MQSPAKMRERGQKHWAGPTHRCVQLQLTDFNSELTSGVALYLCLGMPCAVGVCGAQQLVTDPNGTEVHR